MQDIVERISNIGIVPVVKISSMEDVIPMISALYTGGIDCAEITFRSEYAYDAIKTITKELPHMLIGAGTVLSIEQAEQACQAGASFIVTPGFNEGIVRWCIEHQVPILPGISSASELELALAYGLTNVKFFPAQSSGGAQKLKDLAAPYPMVNFMPTGGIHETNLHEYLSLPNVIAIGGSFMLDQDAITNKDWDCIETLSKRAIKKLLNYELIHIGLHAEDSKQAQQSAKLLCKLFKFTYYEKPKSSFAGRGFEILNEKGLGEHGHIGIYTPYPMRALYQLKKEGILPIASSITRNKKTKQINFVYLDIEILGFAIHLINPDVQMEV